jgi:hypothetical protein
VSVTKRDYLDWMITARKKANTKSNIISAWKKAGLIPFNPDLVLAQLPTIKKDTSEPLLLSIEDITLDEPSSQITGSKIRSSSRSVIPASQITVINGTMIMRFPIGNTQIIKGIINRLDIQTPSLPIYKAHVKTFVQHAAAEALVREATIQKLK